MADSDERFLRAGKLIRFALNPKDSSLIDAIARYENLNHSATTRLSAELGALVDNVIDSDLI